MNYTAKEVMFSSASMCLLVGLFVRRIRQKLGGLISAQNRPHEHSVWISKKGQIKLMSEFKVMALNVWFCPTSSPETEVFIAKLYKKEKISTAQLLKSHMKRVENFDILAR